MSMLQPAAVGMAKDEGPFRRSLTQRPAPAAAAGAAPSPARLAAEVVAGGCAGCIAKTAFAPFTRLTVLAQTSTLVATCQFASANSINVERGMFHVMSQIHKQEGLTALWRGNTLTLIHRFPFTGMQFGIMEVLKRKLPSSMEHQWWGKFVPGAVAAAVAVGSCYPLEIVRTRVMAESGGTHMRGIQGWSTFCHILEKEGVAGLYRGVGVAMAVCVPSLATCYATYAKVQRHGRAKGFPETEVTFMAGGIAGLAGSTLTFPLDVIRRRRQVMGMDPSVPVRNWRAEALHILKSDGLPGFYRGLGPELLKVFPTAALIFLTYEQILSVLTRCSKKWDR